MIELTVAGDIAFKKCSKCGEFKELYRFDNKRDICKECRNKNFYARNKDRLNLKNKKLYPIYREKILKKKKEYHNKIREYIRKKYKEDKLYRFRIITRSRINSSIKNNKIPTKKSEHTRDLLCCDWDYAKNHIEKQFLPDMNWDNHGKLWHIDHIIPISFFDLSDITEQKLCFHWGNLRPLYSFDNYSKNNKIPKMNFFY